jgi:hypothetical protein
MIHPIWKDFFVTLGSADSAEYAIVAGDETIYIGMANKKPGEEQISIKINDICADYLENQRLQDIAKYDGFISRGLTIEFKVFNAIGSLVSSVTFVNDWSYDNTKEDDGVLSAPINGLFDVRMPVLYSVSKAQTIGIDAQDTFADFNIDFSEDFSVSFDQQWNVEASAPGTLILKNIFSQQGNVRIGGLEYRGELTCATHALYYINAYGGWDFLLLQGRTIETDSYDRKISKKGYNNQDVQNRGTSNYMNVVGKEFTLHTGLLYGEQGQKMHHLLGSTDVYLFDIKNQEMIPVVVTNGECRYKSYASEGGRLVEYEITVVVAQDRMRR